MCGCLDILASSAVTSRARTGGRNLRRAIVQGIHSYKVTLVFETILLTNFDLGVHSCFPGARKILPDFHLPEKIP